MSSPLLLQDIRLLCTNVSSKERQSIQELAQEQGAVALSRAAVHDPPHVLITRRVGSAKYSAVMKRNPATPVVTPEWLFESVRSGQRLAYELYRVPALTGLLVCFSGMAVAEKAALAEQVLQHGGHHSPGLHADCTHLVTLSTDSEKYRFAQKNGIVCVTPQWLTDSLAAGWCQDERTYEVSPGGHALVREASAQLAEDEEATVQAEPAPSSAVEPSAGDVSRLAAASQPRSSSVVNTQRGVSRLAREALPAALAGADAASPAAGPTPARQPPAAHLGAWDDLHCDDDAPLFLDACFVWVVGCTAAEAFEALKMCRRSGAKRFVDPPAELVTHIVVGSQITPGEAENVLRYSADNKQAALVRMEWLRRSFARRHALPPDERFSMAPAALADAARRPLAHAPASLATQGRDPGMAALERPPIPGASAGVAATGLAAGGGSLGFLDNCYFTLAAVQGTADEAAAERIIRAHGGRTFNASLPPRVVSRQARAFAICPPSLPPTAAAAVRAANPDFGAVPDNCRFTLYWLQCCDQAGEMVAPQRGSPAFTPLPYPLPLPGMADVSVAISGYEPAVRASIQHLVEVVGGRVSVEYMSACDTHLIVPSAWGEKYRHAARFGVTPVVADWLVDSVTQGRLQPEQNYRPRARPGEAPPPPLPLVDGGAGLRTGSGGALSQIGVTQVPEGGPTGFASLFQAGAPTSGAAAPPAARPASVPVAGAGAAKEPPLRERVRRLAMERQRRAGTDENGAGAGGGAPQAALRPASQECPAAAAAAQPPQPKHAPGCFEIETLLGVDATTRPAARGTSAAPMASSVPVPASIAAPAAAKTGSGAGMLSSGRSAAAAGAAAPVTRAGPRISSSSGGRNLSTKGNKVGTRSGIQQIQQSAIAGQGSDPIAAEANAANEERRSEARSLEDDEIAAAVDGVFAKVRAMDEAEGARLGSQHEMQPPPSRRAAAEENDASYRVIHGSKRSRPVAGSSAAGLPSVRRSTRHKGGPEGEGETVVEMSQQVGYDVAPMVAATGGPGLGAAADAAKQRLRAVTRQRSSVAPPKSALDLL